MARPPVTVYSFGLRYSPILPMPMRPQGGMQPSQSERYLTLCRRRCRWANLNCNARRPAVAQEPRILVFYLIQISVEDKSVATGIAAKIDHVYCDENSDV